MQIINQAVGQKSEDQSGIAIRERDMFDNPSPFLRTVCPSFPYKRRNWSRLKLVIMISLINYAPEVWAGAWKAVALPKKEAAAIRISLTMVFFVVLR